MQFSRISSYVIDNEVV